jgi:hypothetical protein
LVQIIGGGKESQLSEWQHKEVFGRFLKNAVMSGKTGCSLSKINDNNVRRNILQICSIKHSWAVLCDKIAA